MYLPNLWLVFSEVWPDVWSVVPSFFFALGFSFIFNPINVVLCMLIALTVQMLEVVCISVCPYLVIKLHMVDMYCNSRSMAYMGKK